MTARQFLLSLIVFMAPSFWIHSAAQPEASASAPKMHAWQTVRMADGAFDAILRINVTLNENDLNASARIAGLSICSTARCVDVSAPSTVKFTTTRLGQSTLIAEYPIPFMNIASIRFKSVPGPGLLRGTATLPQELQLTKDTPKGTVLVVAQRESEGFSIRSSAANYWNSEGGTFFYNPTFSSTINLSDGSILTIPANATLVPYVFHVAIHDTGDTYPLIDIYPKIKFRQNARLETPPTARGSTTNQGGKTPNLSPLIREIRGTGTLRSEDRGSVSSGMETTFSALNFEVGSTATTSATCNADGWCDCVSQISQPDNQQRISSALYATGSVSIDWCATIPPFVHISVTNGFDLRSKMSLKHEAKVIRPDQVVRLPLQRITALSSNTRVAVNGFTWEGDKGFFAGQFGLPLGHVFSLNYGGIGTRLLGGNLVTGGACDDFTYLPGFNCWNQLSGGRKRILAWRGIMNVNNGVDGFIWRDKSEINAEADLVGGGYFYISSSTSVVRDGICSDDLFTDKFSAIGANQHSGRVVIVSSTSESTTNAATLCGLFKALGVGNAIRLDGSTAAGMTIDGVLKNPLTGLAGVTIGPARYIAYSISIGDSAAGPTPQVVSVSNTTRPTPRNPCRTNPRACQ